MLHAVINLSWKCQLKCPYCWLPHTKIDLDSIEHTPEEWIRAIRKHVPEGGLIDFSGGEPLLYKGIEKILIAMGEADMFWAITTNAINITPLLESDLRGCVQINVSDHSGNKSINIDKLKSKYRVLINRVDHEGAGDRDCVNLIPYQAWEEGEALDNIPRKCTAGCNHWFVVPSGDVYRCSVDAQVGNKPFGNIFDDDFRALSTYNNCDFGCSSCYTDSPSAWFIQMEKL